jgi:NAD(P)H-hydrate repair Nnr-like enzyme with NAD(P)H-hydrate dehydratase domain
LGCVVLLKGPTTLIAGPEGTLRVVRSGTAALATAGTGDVLAGLIAATTARGHDVLTASALAAHLHGRAGARLAPYAPASALIPEVTGILRALEEYW